MIQTSTDSGENLANSRPTVKLATMKTTDPIPRGQPAVVEALAASLAEDDHFGQRDHGRRDLRRTGPCADEQGSIEETKAYRLGHDRKPAQSESVAIFPGDLASVAAL